MVKTWSVKTDEGIVDKDECPDKKDEMCDASSIFIYCGRTYCPKRVK